MDLVSRVKGILLNPKAEWATIDTEPTTVGSLYTGYIMPLAAITAIAGFIGTTVVGTAIGGKLAMSFGLSNAVGGYVMTLVSLFIVALIIDALAPSFGGQKSQIQALKVVAYASTASWVAGIALILPLLGGIVVLVGMIYSLYLFYLGLPTLMKVPAEKAMGYTVVVVIAWIVVGLILAAVVATVLGTGAMLGR